MTIALHGKNIEYSAQSITAFNELDRRVVNIFDAVRAWRGWQAVIDSNTPVDRTLVIVREIFRSVVWYQSHTTEAGFHMIGRLPKHEVKLIQALCSHKAEEAEHGLWAREDFEKLSKPSDREISEHPSPAAFAVTGVWWRMATVENPYGYLGAEYLFEQLTALVTKAFLDVIEKRKLPKTGLRFAIEHATEDAKHATFIRHLILDVVTRVPSSQNAMLRCFDYFHAVYPLQLWDEAYVRAMAASD